jgi:hypothetical protein
VAAGPGTWAGSDARAGIGGGLTFDGGCGTAGDKGLMGDQGLLAELEGGGMNGKGVAYRWKGYAMDGAPGGITCQEGIQEELWGGPPLDEDHG